MKIDIMKESDENKKMILVTFLKSYVDNTNTNVEALEPLDSLTDDDFIDSMGEIIAAKIEAKEEIAESIILKTLAFILSYLNKVTSSAEGKTVVRSEDMPRNFSEDEREFYHWVFDELLRFVQHCVVISGLSEEEENNFDLDGINFCKRIAEAESLVLDGSINPTDYKSYQF